MKPEIMYYLNGTHWDREWYKPFQGFRYQLMNILDEVIETLENDPEYKLYTLDGQTAVLDDYLEISPNMRKRITKLIKNGRIAVGPWYTMPDEFIPSGESLIRNLLMGHKKAIEYGAESAMKYGYVCDIFGHIAQLPQILAGFGIKGALIQRGCNKDTCPPHFRWISPDGTECLVYRTPEDYGYGAFYHFATEAYNQGWDTDLSNLLNRAIKEVNKESEYLNLPFLVLNDALDHQRITKAAPWLADRLAEHFGCEVRFNTLDDMVKVIQPFCEQLPIKYGELAETSKLNNGTNILLTYTLSSRYDIKKINDQTQILWEKWAEPLSAIHAITRRNIRPEFRHIAYLELLRNHAHDSICGCSIEEVHEDMLYRYRQSSSIAEEIIDDCFLQDVNAIKNNDGSNKMILRVFNPLPYNLKRTIKTRLCFNTDFPSVFSEGEREYEYKPSFELVERDGNIVPYTLCSIKHNRINKTPTQYLVDYADIAFSAELAACAYTEFEVLPSDKTRRVRYIDSQSNDSLTAENKFIRLRINEQGSIDLTDLRTGRNFNGIIKFMDEGDIGDGWMHIRPAANRVVFSEGSRNIIEKLYDGPSETAFRITVFMQLPKKMMYDNGQIRRSEDYVTVPISSVLRLGLENDFIDVETSVMNKAMDHCFKLCLPTDVEGCEYFAGQSFTMIQRTIGNIQETGDWKEPQLGERNFNGIAAKRDEKGVGIAFISAYGLHEIKAMSDERKTFAITLFRSFSKTVGTNDYDQIKGELLQELTFAYRILPLTSETSEGDIIRCRDELQAGIRSYSAFVNNDYHLSEDEPFCEIISRDIACSIIKSPEDNSENSLIVRLYNCSDSKAKGVLRFALPIARADETDLLEKIIRPVESNGKEIGISLSARKIFTIRVSFLKS